MRNRWIAVAVSGVAAVGGMGVFADEAAAPAAPAPRRAAPAPAPVNRGGAAPAPAAPRQGNSNGSGGSSTPAPAQSPRLAPKTTPAPSPRPPVTPPGGVAPGTRDANGQPVDAAKANHDAEQRANDAANHDRHRHRYPRYRIPPTSVYGWAPYTFWSGSSYWGPPLGGYGEGWYRDDDGGGASADDYTPPSNNTPPVAPPADTTTPTQEQARALNALEANPDYRAALADLKKAEAEYASASASVIAKLKKESPEYRALVKERDDAKEEVEAVQASAKIPNPESVTPAAQKKLDVKSEITRMEQDAIARDPRASEAKAKVAELSARVAAMRQEARGTSSR